MTTEHAESDSKVIAWRLTQVESAVTGLDTKLDKVISEYPTHAIIANLLAPLNREIKELKDSKIRESEDKARQGQQLKLAMLVAIFSPVATFIVTTVLLNNFSGA